MKFGRADDMLAKLFFETSGRFDSMIEYLGDKKLSQTKIEQLLWS